MILIRSPLHILNNYTKCPKPRPVVLHLDKRGKQKLSIADNDKAEGFETANVFG